MTTRTTRAPKGETTVKQYEEACRIGNELNDFGANLAGIEEIHVLQPRLRPGFSFSTPLIEFPLR